MLAKSVMITLSLIAFSATPAHAMPRDQVLAQYGVVLNSTPEQMATAEVLFTSGGTLQVEEHIYARTDLSTPATTRYFSKQLANATYQSLVSKVEQLGSAEIETTHNNIVCMMMPVFGWQTRVLKVRPYTADGNFIGDLITVDNHAGCWSSVHIKPKNVYDQQTAAALESSLEVLTQELVNE